MKDNLEKNNINNENNKNTGRRRTNRMQNGKVKHNKKKLTKKQKIGIAFGIFAFIIAILGIVLGVYIYKANGNITEAVLNVATDVLGEDDPIFVLVLGVSEDISNPLTDTIMLCGYNPDSQKAFMLSIPRDTFVGKNESWAGGYDKINALYQKDVNKTVDAVESLTGINIDNYVVVKNTALPAIVDAIGEVEFDVPIDMDYDDPTQDLHIHLKAGVQMIDGNEAEQLLRFRHNNDGSSYPSSYGDNDYGRMRTQREFMKTVASQLISWNNTSKLKQIATAVFENLETDLTLGRLVGYIPPALQFSVDSIRMEQLPGSSALLNELWFYKASSSETKELMDELILEMGLDDKEIEKYYTKKIEKTSSNSSSSKKNSKVQNTVSGEKETKAEVNKTQQTQPSSSTTTTTSENNHTHNYSIVSQTNASCLEKGKVTKKCSICGITTTEDIAAKGHSYGSWQVNAAQSQRTKICSACGETITEKIEKQESNSSTNTSQKPSTTVPDKDTDTSKDTTSKEEQKDTSSSENQKPSTPSTGNQPTEQEKNPNTGNQSSSGTQEQPEQSAKPEEPTVPSTPVETPSKEPVVEQPTTSENTTIQETNV